MQKNYDVQLQAQGGTLIVINWGGHTMPNLRLVVLLALAFPLTASITHLQAQQQAQQFVPEAIVCPVPPTGYGAAMSYFVHSSATPGGESHHLATKYCFNQDLDLSDQNTMSSTTPASSSTTTYSYHVGRGRLSLQAESNVTGHKKSIPVPGGTNNLNGRGTGEVVMWLYWVDQLTLHSKTTKPVPTGKGSVIDPSQIVEIRIKTLNHGTNQCSGGGTGKNYYKTSVVVFGETTEKFVMGGHESDNVDENCNDEQANQGTIQVLLGLGQFRVHLGATIQLGADAEDGNGNQETADVKVKLGEYQVCYQVLKGPPDLTITSATGTDYTCPKK